MAITLKVVTVTEEESRKIKKQMRHVDRRDRKPHKANASHPRYIDILTAHYDGQHRCKQEQCQDCPK